MDALRELGEIEKYYHIYENGAKFETDGGEDYIPAVLRSHQIKKLIRREAQFMFGKFPYFRISCPDEQKVDGNRPNESAMQEYINTVLKAAGQAHKRRAGLLYRWQSGGQGQRFF